MSKVYPHTGRVEHSQFSRTHNIDIQMMQKELTKTTDDFKLKKNLWYFVFFKDMQVELLKVHILFCTCWIQYTKEKVVVSNLQKNLSNPKH